jgi:DNA-directed RNA polymerase specialized sigma24 family protein
VNWSTTPPEERQAAKELRALAREVLTPAQYEVYKLSETGVGYRRASALLGISRAAVRDRVIGAERRLVAALAAQQRNGGGRD